ncbi:MAG: 3-hydroxyacyl-ACP dehydratase FabZ [Chloroflexi bacterium]|nr:3-hydroxyacyl-ACP dehydratase FabZ [Chloroflexota bacterium]MCY3697410.1 3-hydroxyacyl-ACP dehydratase FabZ [Chloroflexota bacterium]MXX31223.1 3-hydroxyacyl-ACP dehydratase FabZ [Chloroflexota bacterium]MXX81183.1 3-hydroxyacyl-ACP dehydratase FabZ [Chloroflexota bacterium]MYD15568.1 3-hydroxyacyl-ACP dehydratase FabZ [Chloroflexota bacterium]
MTSSADLQLPLDVRAIQRIIPHRFPILLLDRIVELEPGKRAVGLKNVSTNEWFFEGHFPGNPIMPGVLIVEALAQTGAVAALSADEFQGKLGLFAGIDGVRFRRQVVPGDQLRLEVEMERLRRGIGRANAVASVDGETAAEGRLTFALVDPPNGA